MIELITIKYEFQGPFDMKSGVLLDQASIYAILTKNTIEKYNLLYMGESGQTATRIGSTHHKWNCWNKNKVFGLYYAVLYLPTEKYSRERRLEIESELIKEFNPPCNG